MELLRGAPRKLRIVEVGPPDGLPNVRGLERAVAAEHRRRGGAGQTGGGSLPVKREGETLGAIACSGSSDAIDLACAEAGLASLDSQR